MSAPERIWAWEYQGQHGQEGQWRGSKGSAIEGSRCYIRADETDRLIAEAVANERGVWVEAAIRMMPEAKYLDLMIVAAELREARALIAKDGGE